MPGNESSRQPERAAFNLYLRTGRRADLPPPVQVEVKFNPWHDEEDGRFTFAGQGRYFPRGGGNRAQASLRQRPPTVCTDATSGDELH